MRAGTIRSSTTEELCFGDNNGSITVSIVGGSSPFTYDIGNGPQTPNTFIGLVPGNYSVTVMDGAACSYSIDVTLDGPTQFTTTSLATNETCQGAAGGSIAVIPSGGTLPYQYSSGCGAIFQPGGSFIYLIPDVYCMIYEDVNGCQVTENITILSGTEIAASTNVTNVSCNGLVDGVIQVIPTNGTGHYTYSIGGGAQTNDTFTALSDGVYTVDIPDGNGCTGQTSVTVTEPTILGSTSTTTDEVAGNDGAIDLTVTGGVPPYTYSWVGPNSFSSSTEDPINLAGGFYDVMITDANGCTLEDIGIEVKFSVGFGEHPMDFTIYPNPSNGVFYLQFINFDKEVNVCVIDIMGRLVHAQQVLNQPYFPLDISDKANGTYFIRISSRAYQVTKQIVNQKQ